MSVSHNTQANAISHNAYISSIGYAQLEMSVPREAVVQYNPAPSLLFGTVPDLLGIDRQTAVSSDQGWCGSELGGDPTGCRIMAPAIDSLYNRATADQAHTTCHQFGIQYLIARVYDPSWKDKKGWVWNLPPVVDDEEFRALDCR